MLKSINTLKFILNHPLNRHNKIKSLTRFIKWQVGTRILKLPVIIDFVDDSKIIGIKGDTSCSGVYYTGLLEPEWMGFVLHYLQKNDIFYDIGANIGTYSILAGGCTKAKCISIEPVPETFNLLEQNILINRITNCKLLNIGVAKNKTVLNFTSQLGVINHVSFENTKNTLKINVSPLDDVTKKYGIPDVVKIDVEGFETEVINGGLNTLRNIKVNVLLIELRNHGKRYGFNEKKLFDSILALDFNAYSYDPFERKIHKWQNNNENKIGDIIFIRDIQEAKERIESAKLYRVLNQNL